MKEIALPPPKYPLTLSCHVYSLWRWSFPALSRSPSSSVTPAITANAASFIFADTGCSPLPKYRFVPFLRASAMIVMLMLFNVVFREASHHRYFAELSERLCDAKLPGWVLPFLFEISLVRNFLECRVGT
ncbi:hypothetical protein HPB50_004092 [Hyalomma asiaticum]|uniref:Uncharacterized protein n=1 Tax=Hyalomma asiaticum TaxID=266040 RepID=A0ACB7TEU1_HYAAI|nr:hypothetical protein HPB50_004092 [Hyalomma asiaticum]